MTPDFTDRQKSDFAAFYLSLGNAQEAAVRVGVGSDDAQRAGIMLLQDKKVRRLIRKRRVEGSPGAEALAGLRRLAFGRINDALALLSDDGSTPFPERLDLFNVSEIKKVKGGGVEIKFFNRLEALEKLSEIESQAAEQDSADSFFSALKGSVKGAGNVEL